MFDNLVQYFEKVHTGTFLVESGYNFFNSAWLRDFLLEQLSAFCPFALFYQLKDFSTKHYACFKEKSLQSLPLLSAYLNVAQSTLPIRRSAE